MLVGHCNQIPEASNFLPLVVNVIMLRSNFFVLVVVVVVVGGGEGVMVQKGLRGIWSQSERQTTL
jgi:hypothetical protein